VILAGDVGGTKGRFAALMESIPVRLVLDPRTALLVAARVAQSLVE